MPELSPLIDRSDVVAMLKASQALSSEIDLASLIEKLMRITIEHAGAERGLLILFRAGEPGIASQATTNRGQIELVPVGPGGSSADVPTFAIEQVMRTRQSLIVEDVSVSEICRDSEYLRRHAPSSLLCVPIIKQAELIGALYLENGLAARQFPLDRLVVLEFLAAQAAISLENAYLYAGLKRSEATLAEAQQISNIGSWIWNVAENKLSYSDQNYRIHGYELGDEPSMQALVAQIHPEDRSLVADHIVAARTQRTPVVEDYRIVLPDGSIKHLHSAGHAVLDGNGVPTNEYIGTTMDVTERKRAEDALRDAQAELLHVTRVTTVGELAASIAHELNQPLTSMIANAQSCLRWLTPARLDVDAARNAVERVVRDGNRASDIIRSIRGLLRKSPRGNEPLAINDLIGEVVDLMRSELRRNAVALELCLAEGPAPISGDRVQLQQVLVNLVLNGIEALSGSPAGTRVLRIRTEAVRGELLVTIEDTGPGIDPSRLESIFEAFVTTKPGGVGMGLSICRSVVTAHGGRIWATSHDATGSILHFTLPEAEAAANS